MQFAKSSETMRASEIRRLMKLAGDPNLISFSAGNPNNDLFPVEVMDKIASELTLAAKKAQFQYGPTDGLPPLRESLAKYLESRGLVLEGNKILITTGAQQSINLITKVLCDPQDRILAEDPSFIGALAAFNSYEADVCSVKTDSEGIDIADLEKQIRGDAGNLCKPKFLYVIPYFQNPSGTIYSPKRKKELLETINKYDLPLLEDDPYGELWFDEEYKDWIKPMKAIARDSKRIMYVGSFAKILGPGFRLGYMLAPADLVDKCELAKQSQDACSSSFTQILADAYLRSGELQPYLAGLRPHYKRRAKIMLEALEKYMPEGVSWTTPHGGFFIWATLPQNIDSNEVFKIAAANGAVFVVGKAFDPKGVRNNGMRLAFSGADEGKIDKGIKIIADAVKEVMKR